MCDRLGFIFVLFFQDRRSRRECCRVHDQGHERHKEGPGVPEQGQEEEDYDVAVHDCWWQPGHIHGSQIPRLCVN